VSRGNVEIVRRVYEAAGRRDTEAVLRLYDENVEWDFSHHAYAGVLGSPVYRGHDGLRRYWRDWHEAWESYESELGELVDAGDHVVSLTIEHGRGRKSGVEVERQQSAGVWTVENGRVVRVVWFPTRADALKAAGLQ
jgi:ketosteroid isomerase-like protein